MTVYEFKIKELLSRLITVEADSEAEAYKQVAQMYRDEEVILTDDDYVDTEITRYEQ